MKVEVIEDQATCVKFLMDVGMLDQIVPTEKGKPGCTGLFNLTTTDYCIVDVVKGKYTVVLLTETNVFEAADHFHKAIHYVNRGKPGVATLNVVATKQNLAVN
jgi:hypothetical protein